MWYTSNIRFIRHTLTEGVLVWGHGNISCRRILQVIFSSDLIRLEFLSKSLGFPLLVFKPIKTLCLVFLKIAPMAIFGFGCDVREH